MSAPPFTLRIVAALALACAAVPPAAAQRERGMIRRFVDTVLGQLTRVAEDESAAPDVPPASLQPCSMLYDPDIRHVARGPELARSYTDWIAGGHAVVRRSGLPLPICFEYRHDVLRTKLGHALLTVNNRYIARRDSLRGGAGRTWDGYALTGHTDPAENDTALARRRAEWLQAQSPLPACRYPARADTGRATVAQYRKVTYSYRPAVAGCERPPP